MLKDSELYALEVAQIRELGREILEKKTDQKNIVVPRNPLLWVWHKIYWQDINKVEVFDTREISDPNLNLIIQASSHSIRPLAYLVREWTRSSEQRAEMDIVLFRKMPHEEEFNRLMSVELARSNDPYLAKVCVYTQLSPYGVPYVDFRRSDLATMVVDGVIPTLEALSRYTKTKL